MSLNSTCFGVTETWWEDLHDCSVKSTGYNLVWKQNQANRSGRAVFLCPNCHCMFLSLWELGSKWSEPMFSHIKTKSGPDCYSLQAREWLDFFAHLSIIVRKKQTLIWMAYKRDLMLLELKYPCLFFETWRWQFPNFVSVSSKRRENGARPHHLVR